MVVFRETFTLFTTNHIIVQDVNMLHMGASYQSPQGTGDTCAHDNITNILSTVSNATLLDKSADTLYVLGFFIELYNVLLCCLYVILRI